MNRWEREVRERESARLQRNEIGMRFYRGAFSNSIFFNFLVTCFPTIWLSLVGILATEMLAWHRLCRFP